MAGIPEDSDFYEVSDIVTPDDWRERKKLPANRDRGDDFYEVSDIIDPWAPSKKKSESSRDEEALIGVYPYSGADIKLVVHLPPEDPRIAVRREEEIATELENATLSLDNALSEVQDVSFQEADFQELRQLETQQLSIIEELEEGSDEREAAEGVLDTIREEIVEVSTLLQENSTARNQVVDLHGQITDLSRQLEAAQDEVETPAARTKVLAEIQTLSISSHREKYPVRTLGTVFLRSVTRGPRCLPATERILVKDRGYLNISDIREGDYVQSSAETYNKVLGSWYQGIKPCYKLFLQNGYELTGSFDHPISTQRGWVHLEDLKQTDVVNTVGYSPCSEIDYPIKDELLKMVGYLIGDGQTHIYPKKDSRSLAHVIGLSIADKELNSIGVDVHNCLDELNIGYNDTKKNEDKCIYRQIHICEKEKGLTDWRQRVYNQLHKSLLEYDLYGRYSYQKQIPNEFLSSLSRRQIVLFLNRLWATDGCYSISKDQKYIEAKYSSTSEILIDQIRVLLNKLGINCIKVKNARLAGTIGGRPDIVSRHNSHTLVISESFELVKFIRKVGIYGKDDRILGLVPLLISRIRNKTIFKNQGEFADLVRSILKSRGEFVTPFISKFNLGRSDRPLTIRRAIMVVTELKNDSLLKLVNKKVEELINSKRKIIPFKVKSIEKTIDLPVYDLEVEERHQFIANLIEVHNTVSGSVVFTTFHNHIMSEFLESSKYRSTGVGDWDRFGYSSHLMDQIPPLDISISFANEYGNLSWMTILGVEFINEGMVMSIEDLFLEGTAQYIARDFDPIRSVASRRMEPNKGIGQSLMGTKLLAESLRRRVAHRNVPWI